MELDLRPRAGRQKMSEQDTRWLCVGKCRDEPRREIDRICFTQSVSRVLCKSKH